MGKVDSFSCVLINHQTQIVSPDDDASYLIASSGVTGDDWPGHEDHIATWHNTFGWVFQPPKRGTFVYDELRGQQLRYDGTNWTKASQFTVEGSGDQDYTAGFVALTNWDTPTKIDGPGSYGAFSFASGVLKLERDVKQVTLKAVVGGRQTSSGNLNHFVARIEKSTDGGSNWNAIGAEVGDSTYNNSGMSEGSMALCAEDYDANEDDEYRIAIKQTGGTGTITAKGLGIHWHACERI